MIPYTSKRFNPLAYIRQGGEMNLEALKAENDRLRAELEQWKPKTVISYKDIEFWGAMGEQIIRVKIDTGVAVSAEVLK